MIRKLTMNDHIREGDFTTDNGKPDGDRKNVPSFLNCRSIASFDHPAIFREVPDVFSCTDKNNFTMSWKPSWFTDSLEKQQVKDFANWLLEIAEAMQ